MQKLFLVLISAILLAGCTPKDLFVKPPAGLEIATIPASTVFLNGVSKGETPYSDKNLKPGTYTLKLIPTGTPLPAHEINLTLTSKASTIISRTFAESDLDSSGYTLELKEEASGGTYLSVISDPDTVNVTIDDKPSGFTPLSKLPASPGTHSITVNSPGYTEQILSVNTVKGYNLVVNFKLAGVNITLAPSEPATPSASLSPSPSPSLLSSPTPSDESSVSFPKPYALIGETGTGWLRVRKESSGTSEELGKVDTGEKLKYLGESTDLGWHKIEFEGSVGWVSGKYVTLVK
ncbi:MAG: PEGA domain-containing protein [bacterium]